MILKDIVIRRIFDSRSEETLEVGVSDIYGKWFWGQVPSGKSRGTNEAAVVSFEKAKSIFARQVRKKLINTDFDSLKDLDIYLISLDGTRTKERLGGNLMLGLSLAFARAISAERNHEVWQMLNRNFFGGVTSKVRPRIFSNLINGGAHAANGLDIQEYMVVVKPGPRYSASIARLVKLYKELGVVLGRRVGGGVVPLGDEAGYAVRFRNNLEPLLLLEGLIRKFRLSRDFLLGLDVAATNFHRKNSYFWECRNIAPRKLIDIYAAYARRIKLLYSFEDPFAEDDFYGFGALKHRFGRGLVVGDDLTTTNPFSIQRAVDDDLINAVIIKPNQIGTITETCQAIKIAHGHGIKTIISHRSGETNDDFIIHLAKAAGAFGVKIGAPARERMSKFNALIRLWDK